MFRSGRLVIGSVLIACVVLGTGVKVWSTREVVRLQLPEWVTGATCQLSPAGGGSPTIFQRSIPIACLGASGVVSCSGGNIEPADIPVAEACGDGVIRLTPGTNRIIDPGSSHDISVEWFTLSPQGRLQRLAIRSPTINGPFQIQVADRNDRLVRFSRPGTSSISVAATDLALGTWTLPEPRLGGELIAWAQSAAVSPAGYRITGVLERSLERTRTGPIVISGLPSGDYEIQPFYPGGLTGLKSSARVVSEASTLVVLKPERVGAIRVTTSIVPCLAPELYLSVVDEANPDVRRTVVRLPDDSGTCNWTVGGLVPGLYQVDIVAQTGSAGSRSGVEVHAQGITDVALAPNTFLSGRVLLNGGPLSMIRLEFIPRGMRSPTVAVLTDEGGRYAVTLSSPGAYVATVKNDSVALANRLVELQTGDNRFDWAINGGSLRVRARGVRQDLPLSILIESRRRGDRDELAPGAEPEVVKALEFDTYSVSAVQADELVSEVTTVVLGPAHPWATVDVDMIENRSDLTVRTTGGLQARNTNVRTMNPADPSRASGRLDESEPGVFSLRGVRPGSHLLIAADDVVPVCRIARSNTSVSARLEAGRSVELQLPPDITRQAIEVTGVRDSVESECVVPLKAFMPDLVNDPFSGQLTIRIKHFPSSYRLDLERPGLVRTIAVPDGGGRVTVESESRPKP